MNLASSRWQEDAERSRRRRAGTGRNDDEDRRSVAHHRSSGDGRGGTDEEIARAREKAKGQIAFYGSTPAYRVMLDHHGWGGLQPELNRLSKQGQWFDMMQLVTDEMLDTIGVSGTPANVGRTLRARNAFAERTSLVLYNETEPDAVVDIVRGFKEGLSHAVRGSAGRSWPATEPE